MVGHVLLRTPVQCVHAHTGRSHARSKHKQVDENNVPHARKESELRSPTLSVLFGPVSGRCAVAHDLAARAHAMPTHACTQVTTYTWVMLKGNRLWGTVKHQHGIPIPASVAALTKRQERPSPRPLPPPRPLPHKLKQRLHKQGPSLHQTQWFTQIQSAGGSLFLQAPLQPLWWRRSRWPQAPH